MPRKILQIPLIASLFFVCSAKTHTVYAFDTRLTQSVRDLHIQLSDEQRRTGNFVSMFVENWIDIDAFSNNIFSDYLLNSIESYTNVLSEAQFDLLSKQYTEQLHQMLLERLIEDAKHFLYESDVNGITLISVNKNNQTGIVNVKLSTEPPILLELLLHLNNDMWRIEDIMKDGKKLSSHYRNLSAAVIDKAYSLPILAAHLKQRRDRNKNYVVIEDFSTTPIGQLPLDWGSWRKKDKNKPIPYRVEGLSQRYLAARDSNNSVILGKFLHWDPKEYPILSWCWRANHLPPGGNEFVNEANDSAVGLYVIFSQNWLRVPKQIKYVWSTTLPNGTIGRRNKIFRPWFFVKESGNDNVGRWQFEVVDLEHDHRLKLGGSPTDRTIGLGILSDANSTGSYAEGFYADFRIWKRPKDAKISINDHCGTLRRNSFIQSND